MAETRTGAHSTSADGAADGQTVVGDDAGNDAGDDLGNKVGNDVSDSGGRREAVTSRGSAVAIRPRDEVTHFSPQQRNEMGARGSLEVKDKAVERIAEAAVLEVSGVAPAGDTAGVLGATLGAALGRSYPRVDVHVAGHRVHAQVEIVTHWPRPAAQVAAAVRDHVADRLQTLAALDVDAVEVQVAKVIRRTTPEKRRVQ
ncbi:alkaline shock response membrane anchor protein AmaP [Kineococcus sp. NBC_00420]|uniref:Asp23/Gls24 family envelope stress response protein n=1 Tax=Kineococcus sp. NBC_00420 TaxID=2903564 RepID=UPI002E1BBD98